MARRSFGGNLAQFPCYKFLADAVAIHDIAVSLPDSLEHVRHIGCGRVVFRAHFINIFDNPGNNGHSFVVFVFFQQFNADFTDGSVHFHLFD
ncbi:hypothetical protein [Klebsiella quasipneumoniae]|uniref:hypothetical protein n=1 Tax=Klebsiella quasipneumoniae TaxID=1463165 RepID=UPI000942833C|nr:hypothetical protein [Klebsiella quasipneumoniae]